MRIGIDNYGLFPLNLSPLETLEWAFAHGAEGVQFSGMPEHQPEPSASQLKELADYAAEQGMYLEWGGGQHIPYETLTWKEKDIFSVNRKAAGQAEILGAGIVRSCSGGLFRVERDSPDIDVLMRETAEALSSQQGMLADHGVTLAVETHFEFTSFELLRIFEMCDAEPGGWLGICLDTMNLLVLLEDPLEAVDRLLPWIVSTHIKDGGILLGEEGFTVFPIEIGRGIVDIQGIASRFKSLGRGVNLSIEDHGGSFGLNIFDRAFLRHFPDLGAEELSRLVQLAYHSRKKRSLGLRDITTRPLWPSVCEERIVRDLAALKGIINP
jgi:sugar phosphate isomerase/epimerase